MSENFNFRTALALHLIVLVCWVAYTFYQPIIFSSLGLEQLSKNFTFYQALLLVLVPIFAGILADKLFSKNKNSILLILIGLMLTACIFLASASFLFRNTPDSLQYLPFLMILWIIGMNLFYLPGLNVLAEIAASLNAEKASVYTGASTDIIYALAPFLILFFGKIGAAATFIAGGVLLLVLFFLFKKNNARFVVQQNYSNEPDSLLTSILIAFSIGVGLGFVHHVQLHNLHFSFFHSTHERLPSIILVFASLALLFLHKKLHDIGFRKSFALGMIFCFSSYALQYMNHTIIFECLSLVILLFGVIFVSGSAFGAAFMGISNTWRNVIIGFLLSGFNLLGFFQH